MEEAAHGPAGVGRARAVVWWERVVGESVAARCWRDVGGRRLWFGWRGGHGGLLVFAVVPAPWESEGVLGVLGGGGREVGVKPVGFEWARFAGVRDGRDGSGLV